MGIYIQDTGLSERMGSINCKHHKSHLRNRIVIGRILPWGNAIVRCIPQDRTMGYRSDDDVHVASDLLYIN